MCVRVYFIIELGKLIMKSLNQFIHVLSKLDECMNDIVGVCGLCAEVWWL